MGFCSDPGIAHLNSLGYNVVRVPREGISPLQILGRQSGTTSPLGDLQGLMTDVAAPPPSIARNQAAASVGGSKSGRLKTGIALEFLGTVVAALGGKAAVASAFSSARTLQFQYEDILSDSVKALDVGKYLREGDVDSTNPVLRDYVLGKGRLFLIVETLKSSRFTVSAEAAKDHEHRLELPAIRRALDGSVDVEGQSERTSRVTFKGKTPLVFGFRAMELGVRAGSLSLVNVAPSPDMAYATSDEDDEVAPVLLETQSLVGIGD